MAIAFFDLDRTLISVNSAILWLRSELRLGHVSPLKALVAGVWVARYQLGFSGSGEGLRHAIASLAGNKEAELKARSLSFYEANVRGHYRPGARQALEAHRARGDRLVLLTSTSSYIAEQVAKELGLDHVLCNRFEVDDAGLYTGRPVGGLCYAGGKLEHARAFAEAQGEDLSQAWFYTDSFTDLPVLLAVGHPVAVNPDFRLRREAQSRGWEIVDWGEPEPVVEMPPAP